MSQTRGQLQSVVSIRSKRITFLSEIMDSAYDASAIYQASADRNHQPIIHPHTRRKSETQLPLLVKLQPQLGPAKAERYKIRTMVERVFGRLKVSGRPSPALRKF